MNFAEDGSSSSPSKLLAIIATIYLIFVFYGSWVPLNFTPLPLAKALQTFSALPFLDQAIDSATDWATNFLLLIPLTFLWAQRLLPKQRGFSSLAFRLALMGLGVAVAFALEFSQIYFPPRTVSQKDILALSLGAVVGVVAQYRWGSIVENWLGMIWQRESQQGRLIRMLQVYLLVLFAFSVLPLDLTLSPVELYHKWSGGGVVLIPFGELKGSFFDKFYETATDLLIWVPVGLFLSLGRKASLFRVAMAGWLAGAVIEVAQLFVYSRVADVTDVLLAGVGAAIGWVLANRSHNKFALLADVRPGFWYLLWAGWAGAVLCVFWFPFNFQASGASLEMAWTAFTRMPFIMLFQGTELNAANEMLRKIGIFLPGGILWCLGAAAIQTEKGSTWSKLNGIWVFAAVAMIVEGGQLFLPGKFADLTDALLETGGALLGLRIGSWVLTGDRSRRELAPTIAPKGDSLPSDLKSDDYSVAETLYKGANHNSSHQLELAPPGKRIAPLDFLPLALTSLGLALLIGKADLLTLPPLWGWLSIACILALAVSSRFPEVTVISYLVLAYALPRYTKEYVFLIQAGLFDWICLIGFSGWIVWCARRRTWPMWRHPVCLVFFAFLVVLALSWAVASWDNTYRVYPRHTPLLFLHALVLFLITSSLPIRGKSIAIWGLILCIFPSLRWFLQGSEGLYLDNDISSFTTLLLPIALVGGWYVQHIWVRTLFFSSAIAMIGIIGLAQNRGSAISLALGLLYLFWCEITRRRLEQSRKNKGLLADRLSGLHPESGSILKKLSIPVVILLILAFSYALLPLKEYQARFSVLWNHNATHATAGLDRATINERYELWSGGIEMALDHPLIGVGPGNFANLIGIYQIGKSKLPAHNTIIAVAAEAGFIGLALFLLLVFLGFRTLGHVSKQSKRLVFQGTGVALQASMVAFIAVSMFISRHDQVFLYVVLGLAVALSVALKADRMSRVGKFRGAASDIDGQAPAPTRALPEQTVPETAAQAHINRLGGLDGLRAIAALSVFGVHFNQMAGLDASIGPFNLGRWLANGNTGVALFFVLSGFLLSLPYWRQGPATGSRIDIKSYLIRRLARILPAYYLCLFGLFAIKLASGHAPSINNILAHIVFLFSINDSNILSLNSPFWSLAVETQFYLLLPLLMMALSGLSARVALALLSTLAVGAYCANYGLMTYLLQRDQWPIQFTLIWPFSLYISGPGSFVLTYSFLAHLTYFLIGIATALVFVIRTRGNAAFTDRSAVADLVFWSCATLVFLILSTPLDDVLQTPHGHYNWPFVPLLLGAMIFVTPRTKIAQTILESRPLRGLGAISYGFYIFHYPIQSFVARLFGQAGLSMIDFWWLFAALSFAGTVSVAAVSYWLLELPVMRWARGRRVWRPVRPIQVQLAAADSVSASRGKEASPEHSSGSDWTEVKVRFRRRQLEALKHFSDTQRLSLSGAARHLLATCMADSCKSWAPVQLWAHIDREQVDGDGETCRVNMHSRQYDFLLEAADRIGSSIDEVFCLIIDHYVINR